MSVPASDEESTPAAREPRTTSPRWVGLLLGVAVLAMVTASRSCSSRSTAETGPDVSPGGTSMPSDR